MTAPPRPAYKDGVAGSELILRRGTALFAGLAGPAAACAAMAPFRGHLPNIDAVLVLVLIAVAVGSPGNRLGGLLGALSAEVWFGFFLTKPYESFSIDSGQAVGTTILLLLIGFGVTELGLSLHATRSPIRHRGPTSAQPGPGGLANIQVNGSDRSGDPVNYDPDTLALHKIVDHASELRK
jgi:hypothetical protein